MQKQNKALIRTAVIVLLLILLAICLRFIGNAGTLPTFAGLVRSFIYIGLFGAWGVSVWRRIVQKQIRRYLLAASVLIVFWLTIINYFDGNGKVFLSPEDYYAFALGEQTHYCKWEIADGKAVYWAIGSPDEAPVKCDITFDSDLQMSITWPDGVTSNFMKNTSQKASLFLKKGDYPYHKYHMCPKRSWDWSA